MTTTTTRLSRTRDVVKSLIPSPIEDGLSLSPSHKK